MQHNWSCGFMQRYVVTVDLAKRLKAAGWRLATAFSWYTDELMSGKWFLGRVESELVMLPAATAGELLECFSPGDLKIEWDRDGYEVSLQSGIKVKKYRLVDALAELWIMDVQARAACEGTKWVSNKNRGAGYGEVPLRELRKGRGTGGGPCEQGDKKVL